LVDVIFTSLPIKISSSRELRNSSILLVQWQLQDVKENINHLKMGSLKRILLSRKLKLEA
jgi:hypothetical protein